MEQHERQQLESARRKGAKERRIGEGQTLELKHLIRCGTKVFDDVNSVGVKNNNNEMCVVYQLVVQNEISRRLSTPVCECSC